MNKKIKRYFVELAYDGTDFHGWQSQPNTITVQSAIEEALKVVLRFPIDVIGCGRTDAGVHASSYWIHFDAPEFDGKKMFGVNSVLPNSIVLHQYREVSQDSHARFSATKRKYVYYAHADDSPFLNRFSSRIVALKKINLNDLNRTAKLFLEYDEFLPFCKAHADNATMFCQLYESNWVKNNDTNQFEFHVSSNRFLRGMVRLMVGTCVKVGKGELTIQDVKHALDNQQRLKKNWSAPPEGLFLTEIEYPKKVFYD